MKYILTTIFFSSIVSADNEVIDEVVPSIPCEEMEYITIRGDSNPAPDPNPVVMYPIEDFMLIEEEAK